MLPSVRSVKWNFTIAATILRKCCQVYRAVSHGQLTFEEPRRSRRGRANERSVPNDVANGPWHNFLRRRDGSQKTFILSPACAMSLRHIAEKNLPRSIDTSVHGAGKLSRPQSFALWKVPLSVERSTGPFCENPRSLGVGGGGGNRAQAAGRYYVLFLSRLLPPPGCLDKYTGVHYWGWRSVSERLKVRIYIPRYLRCTREILRQVFQPKKFSAGRGARIFSRFSWRSRMCFERKEETRNLVASQTSSSVQR